MDHKSLYKIIHFIETKLGLKSHAISLLIWKDRIKERMVACQLSTYEEYEQLVQTSLQELQELIELMVNPETWFFRERGAFDYLTHMIKYTNMQIHDFKILSIACSTGEEPYSIAMTLLDAGLPKNRFRIDAFDISRKVLNEAQIGIYREKSFRERDLYFRDRYFNLTSLGYSVKNKVKKQVFFYEVDILKIKNFAAQFYQVIFCRNLLIYLHQEAQMGLLNCIKTFLAPQGILIVGSAETKIAQKADFKPILFPGANAFKLQEV